MDATENRKLVERLYQAFARKDGDGMAACYGPDATFTDPVFPDLVGPEVGAMWRMLCARATDLELTVEDIGADLLGGRARWVARYTFSATGRRVTNAVTSVITVRDGVIAAQTDQFDFWRWSRQALGPAGWLLGWTPMIRRKVRAQARANLDSFLAGRA